MTDIVQEDDGTWSVLLSPLWTGLKVTGLTSQEHALASSDAIDAAMLAEIREYHSCED